MGKTSASSRTPLGAMTEAELKVYAEAKQDFVNEPPPPNKPPYKPRWTGPPRSTQQLRDIPFCEYSPEEWARLRVRRHREEEADRKRHIKEHYADKKAGRMPSYDENGEWIQYDYAGAAFKLGVMYYGMIFFVFAHVYSSIPKGFLDNNNVVGLVRYHGYCGLTEEASTVAWHRVGDNRSRADTIVIPPYASSWWPPAAFVWARPPPLKEMAPLGDDDREVVNLYDGEGRPRHCPLDGRHDIYTAAEGIPWQWAPESVGATRPVAVAADDAWYRYVDGPPGTPPDANETRANKVRDEHWDKHDRFTFETRPLPDGKRYRESNKTLDLETISAYPPIFRVRSFVPEEVVDDLRRRARSQLEPSPVGDVGRRSFDERRKSKSAWLHGRNDPARSLPAARFVQNRATELLRIDPTRQLRDLAIEPLLVVEYTPGDYYVPHHDYFGKADDTCPPDAGNGACIYMTPRGSNRHATILLFLEEPDEGGHVVFPYAAQTAASSKLDGVSFLQDPNSGVTCDYPFHSQQQGLAVKPTKGDAILFYSQKPDGSLDDASLHGACPVLKGKKMVANIWAWNRNAVYR